MQNGVIWKAKARLGSMSSHNVKRTIYQASIWKIIYAPQVVIPSPGTWGWGSENANWVPHWMTQSAAPQACLDLARCKCKKRACNNCNCNIANLPCTYLCNCTCELNLLSNKWTTSKKSQPYSVDIYYTLILISSCIFDLSLGVA